MMIDALSAALIRTKARTETELVDEIVKVLKRLDQIKYLEELNAVVKKEAARPGWRIEYALTGMLHFAFQSLCLRLNRDKARKIVDDMLAIDEVHE